MINIGIIKKFKDKYIKKGIKIGFQQGVEQTKKEYNELVCQLVENQLFLEYQDHLKYYGFREEPCYLEEDEELNFNEYISSFESESEFEADETRILSAIDDIMLWFNSLIEIINTNFIINSYFDSKNYNSKSIYEILIFIEFAITSENIKKLYPKTFYFLPELKKVFSKVYNNKLIHEEAERLGKKKPNGNNNNN